MKAKYLINRSFNIGCYIAIIRETNINPSIPQCKNCWKWRHTTFTCYTHWMKCLKCNGPHKLEHHREIVWCFKANFKTNPLRLEMKKGELYTHSFKYITCKSKHQVDNNNCSFWKYRFNRDWCNKKLQELSEIRANSIHSAVGKIKIWF